MTKQAWAKLGEQLWQLWLVSRRFLLSISGQEASGDQEQEGLQVGPWFLMLSLSSIASFPNKFEDESDSYWVYWWNMFCQAVQAARDQEGESAESWYRDRSHGDLHRIWGSCVSPRPSERPWKPWKYRKTVQNNTKQIKTSWLTMAYHGVQLLPGHSINLIWSNNSFDHNCWPGSLTSFGRRRAAKALCREAQRLFVSTSWAKFNTNSGTWCNVGQS